VHVTAKHSLLPLSLPIHLSVHPHISTHACAFAKAAELRAYAPYRTQHAAICPASETLVPISSGIKTRHRKQAQHASQEGRLPRGAKCACHIPLTRRASFRCL